MDMLNLFSDKSREEFKTGFLLDNNNMIPFRYKSMNRLDTSRVELLNNLIGEDYSMVIKTSAALDFNSSKRIKIKNTIYTILSKYEVEEEKTNGYFVESYNTIKYITLKA